MLPMELVIRQLGVQEYATTYQAMRDYTLARNQNMVDEIWCLQHPPVYTLGLGAKTSHVLEPGRIPVIRTDRGGQVTYHGPGQLVVYILLNLQHRSLTVKGFVTALEQALIDYLDDKNIQAERKQNAPGVYVDGAKIAALGVRVKRQCTYHGLALNVDMDLGPYKGINPCGYADQSVTALNKLGVRSTVEQEFQALLPQLLQHLNVPEDVRLRTTSKINDCVAA